MYCTRLAENTGRKNDAKIRYLSTIGRLCRTMSSQLRHISTIGKNLLNSNISPTCPYNMVNFGPLVTDIGSLVWGTPANFNEFRVLAALLHGTLVVGVSQTLSVEQKAPPIFGRAAITLGIGPHSSFTSFTSFASWLHKPTLCVIWTLNSCYVEVFNIYNKKLNNGAVH